MSKTRYLCGKYTKAMSTKKNYKVQASADNLLLGVTAFIPDASDPVKGVLQMVHGMAEHRGRYEPLMEYLADNGYICVMHDNRGHGESIKENRDLGYMYKGGSKALVEDVFSVNQWIQDEFAGQRVFLFGHSMGSMIVREYLKKHDDTIEGLIVCGSPSKEPVAGVGRFICQTISLFHGERHISPTMVKLTTGSYNKDFADEGSVSSWICSDKAVVKAYDADPLCGFPFTCNGYKALLDLSIDIYKDKGWLVKRRGLPIHFISGALDPCRKTDKAFGEAVLFMQKVGYPKVTSKLYPNMRHEIHNEIGKEKVWQDILETLSEW